MTWSILLGPHSPASVIGARRAWRWALLGIVLAIVFAAASTVASNKTLPGTEDSSWRILFIEAAIVAPARFYAALLLGALAK